MQVGRYRIVERLAVGGMAELFLATRAAGDDQRVVIKRLLPHLVYEDGFAAMFFDEAKLSMRLDHPRIVETLELGYHDEQPFIAMEYIDGVDVSALMRECARNGTRLAARVGVYVACAVLEALDFAHRLSDDEGAPLHLVHRDVSPSNVLLSRGGDVKLLDFGIAWTARRTHRTRTGVLKGKYQYMSPEQVLERPLDARSDLFSAAVMLAELLMGRRLFVAEREFDLLLMVRAARLDRLDRFGKHIDPELDAIVRRALSLEPDQRFASAAEFRAALDAWRQAHVLPVDGSDIAKLVEKYYARCHVRRPGLAPPIPPAGPEWPRRPVTQSGATQDLSPVGPGGPAGDGDRAAAEAPGAWYAEPTEQMSAVAELDDGAAAESDAEAAGGRPWPARRRDSDPAEAGAEAGETRPLQGLAGPRDTIESRSTILLWALEEPLGVGARLADHADSDGGSPSVAGAPGWRSPQGLVDSLSGGDRLRASIAGAGAGEGGLDGGEREVDDESLRRLLPPSHERYDTHDDLSGAGIAIHGEFASLSPLRLLYQLAVARVGGLLTVSLGDIRKEIYLRDGVPCYVASNIHAELLGQYLAQQGVLSAGELSMALAMLPSYNGRLGAVLVDLELLTQEAYEQHLAGQVRHKLVDVCTWCKGNYVWQSDRTPPTDALPLELDLFEILGAGAMAVSEDVLDPWLEAVAGARVRPAGRAGPSAVDFGLSRLMAALWARIDGTRSVAELRDGFEELAEVGGRPRCIRGLYLLAQTGMVTLEPAESDVRRERAV